MILRPATKNLPTRKIGRRLLSAIMPARRGGEHARDPAGYRRLCVARPRHGGLPALAAATVAGAARRDRSRADIGAGASPARGGAECGGFSAGLLCAARRRDPPPAGGWRRPFAVSGHGARRVLAR